MKHLGQLQYSYMKQATDTVNQLIQQALQELSITVPVTIDIDTQPQQGDLSTNLAMQLFKQLPNPASVAASPRELAQKIVDALQKHITTTDGLISKVEVAGPGFINFHLSEHFLMAEIQVIAQKRADIIPHIAKDEKAIVEYSSPNIAKPFTIGHLRSTIIGDAVANLMAAIGYQVFRDNHLGDWGTQFGKQIYAIKTWGDEQEIEAAERPIKKLVELYVKFHEEADQDPAIEEEGRAWFKKLEDGDAEARRLWQKCIDWSWKEFDQIYSKLGVSFTENNGRGYGESYFEDQMADTLKELESKGLISDSQGAKVIYFPEEKLPPLMVVKKDGATLYATRDLATDRFRKKEYQPDVIVNEVGAEQSLYFQQIFETEYLAGWYQPGQRVHVKHGLYRFKDKKMSTRKGNVIWLEDVLEEAFQRVKKQAQDRIDDATIWKIAIGALKWNDLRRSSHLDVVFDWDEVLTIEGNSGPYVQYTYVRANSILQKAESSTITKQSDSLLYSLSESEKALAKHLLRFPEMVTKAAKEYAPHHLATYVYALAQSFNSFYNQHSVLGEDVPPEARTVRLALTQAVASTLQKGLGLMGIEIVEKM